MTAQDALGIATGVALLSVALFLIAYAVRARETWWRDSLGRALMLGGLGVGGLAAVGSVRRIDNRIDSIDLADELIIASTFAYLAVAAVWLYKARVVYRETRRDTRQKAAARAKLNREGMSHVSDTEGNL